MLNKSAFLLITLLVSFSFQALAAESIGSVKSITGSAEIVRDGSIIQAVSGLELLQKDIVRTHKESTLGLILHDDTILSLGAESELDLAEYVFEPQDTRFSVVIKFVKGTFVYLSGVIGKLAPDSIRLETPTSSIAVRGTRLLVKVEG